MSKEKKIIIIVVLVLLIIVLAAIGFFKHPHSAEEIENSPETAIAEELGAENIEIIASCENDKEKVFVFKKDGELMSGFAVKSLLLPRYQIVCGDMDSSDKTEENKDLDLSEAQNFRIRGYTEEHLYSYEDGEFTLESTTKRMHEEVKNLIIRAVCGIGIICVVLFTKTKKEN